MQERVNKVASGLKKHVSTIIQLKVKDPTIAEVTITDVDLSADLRSARISYLTNAEKNDSKKIHRHLRRAISFIRKELARDMALRYVPRITFVQDHSAEQRQELDEIYKRIKEKEGENEE